LPPTLGPKAIAFAFYVADRVQVAAIFDQVRDQFGGLDLLFSNAGLGVNSPFEKRNPDDWTRMIDVNLTACFTAPTLPSHCCSVVQVHDLPVSSVGGHYGVVNWSVYGVTKFAVVGFHNALRK